MQQKAAGLPRRVAVPSPQAWGRTRVVAISDFLRNAQNDSLFRATPVMGNFTSQVVLFQCLMLHCIIKEGEPE
ncbi:hypothetical protein MTBUT4_30173 [Magnetospirillum sp. UT-4]|nr:hypothetical protein MTBUT4_30173 [Magnetospirillum sp. UT-4]